MRVTTLIENNPGRTDRQLVSEWGLSLHVALKEHTILFDTGASGSFAKNAERLSVDLSCVEAAVLSHHHFDHAGGLRRFLELNATAKVHLGQAPGGDPYARIFGFLKKYVGLDRSLATDYADRFVVVTEPAEIMTDVFLLPVAGGRPAGRKTGLYIRKEGRLVPDDFSHEIVMAIKDNGGLVVFTGCSHNGVIAMVDTVRKHFKGIRVRALIGGFHLASPTPFKGMESSRREVSDLAKAVLNYPIGMTYTGHCTGAKGFSVLKAAMGDRIVAMQTGSSFEV